MNMHVDYCCRICVIPEPQQWVVVRAGSVLRAGSKLEAARDDSDVDKSVPCTRLHLLIIHAIEPKHSQPQADLFRHHYADQSYPLLSARRLYHYA